MTTFILGNILGFMLFFPIVIAPIVFKILNQQKSSEFLRLFFPRYYIFGIVWSFVGLIYSVYEKSNLLIFSFIFLILTFLFSKQILTPAINKNRDINNLIKFEKLHKTSVFINFLQILLCIFLVLNILIFKYVLEF